MSRCWGRGRRVPRLATEEEGLHTLGEVVVGLRLGYTGGLVMNRIIFVKVIRVGELADCLLQEVRGLHLAWYTATELGLVS